MVFPLVMYGCESWTIKKAERQRIDAFELWLEKTLESPLDCKEIQPINSKGNQCWIFIGRTDAEAETPILWPPDAKNWCLQIVVLEKTLESPLDYKEIKSVLRKKNQPWIFIGRMDAEAEVPIFEPPDVRSWLTGKDPDAGKDWRQEEKETTGDETVGWHHQLNGHEFGQAPGVRDGQGSLACCSPRGRKELDTT